MPEFAYVAYTQEGKKRRGSVTGRDERNAHAALRERGLVVVALRERRRFSGAWSSLRAMDRRRRVPLQQFAVFCRQLATLLDAGVSLLQGIRVLASQMESRTLRAALAEAAQGLSEGRSFSAVASERPKAFPVLFSNMVKAAEASGTLDQVLSRLAGYYEKQYYTREKIKSALAYPAVLAVVTVLAASFLFVVVVPTFVREFDTLRAALPWPTTAVLAAGEFLARYGWIVAAALAAAAAGHLLRLRRPGYRERVDRLILRAPVVGQLLQKGVLARALRTLATLLASAVPILESLRIAADVSDNAAVGAALRRAADQVGEGWPLAEPIRKSDVFPPLVAQMIAVGEESGSLDGMLGKIADFYEAETDAGSERLRSLLEPVMILALGGVVGIVVLAVVLPYFTILSHIG